MVVPGLESKITVSLGCLTLARLKYQSQYRTCESPINKIRCGAGEVGIASNIVAPSKVSSGKSTVVEVEAGRSTSRACPNEGEGV